MVAAVDAALVDGELVLLLFDEPLLPQAATSAASAMTAAARKAVLLRLGRFKFAPFPRGPLKARPAV